MTKWKVYKMDEFVGYVWALDEPTAHSIAEARYGLGVYVERAS